MRREVARVLATDDDRRALRIAAARDDMGGVAEWLLRLAQIVIAENLTLDEVRIRLRAHEGRDAGHIPA